MTDIPDWAGKRACELLNAGAAATGSSARWFWPNDNHNYIPRTLAKLVMQHEQPPVDPDVEAVKRILRAWCRGYDDALFEDVDERVARTVAQYKKERGHE